MTTETKKVAVLGDSNSGKTTLLELVINKKKITQTQYQETVIVDFYTQLYTSKEYKLLIYGFAGKRHGKIPFHYGYNRTDKIRYELYVLCVSLYEIESSIKYLEKIKLSQDALENQKFMLVFTKKDLASEENKKKEALDQIAKRVTEAVGLKKLIRYQVTSAKTGENSKNLADKWLAMIIPAMATPSILTRWKAVALKWKILASSVVLLNIVLAVVAAVLPFTLAVTLPLIGKINVGMLVTIGASTTATTTLAGHGAHVARTKVKSASTNQHSILSNKEPKKTLPEPIGSTQSAAYAC